MTIERAATTQRATERKKNRAISVMMADDHELIRQGLRAILELEDDINIIGEMCNGYKVVSAIEAGARPDVVLMDLQMPVMSGVEATERITQLLPDTPVICLTAVDEEASRLQMLDAGAYDYVIKSAAADELISVIRCATGHHRFSPLQSEQRQARIDTRKPERPKLTARELEVMRILMKGHSNKEIARRLVISERTVQTHLSNIFGKIDVHSRTEAVLFAMREGLDL